MAKPLIVPPDAVGAADHFVGRYQELAVFRRMRETASGRAKPQLAIVQAPPGAGKTALLREVGRIAETEGAVVLEAPPATLDDGVVLRDRVVSQLSYRDRWRDLLPEMRLGVSTSAGASASGVGRPRSAASVFLDGLLSLSERCGVGAGKPSGVLVVIDEAQKLADRPPGTVELLLDALRNQPGLRTLTVLAGLPDTTDALRSPSLARAHRKMGLGPLQRPESVELLHLWLEDNDFRPEHPARLHEIADHAQDWPEHLMHHITAMIETAAKNGGTVDDTVVAQTTAAAIPAMKSYYRDRLDVLSDRPLEEEYALTALAAAAGMLGRDLTSNGAKRIVRAAGADESVLRRLRHAGVLVHRDDRSFAFAIPSLRSYVIETSVRLSAELDAEVERVVAAEPPQAGAS